MKITDNVVTTKEQAWRKGSATSAGTNRNSNLVITDIEDQVWAGFGGCFNEIGWQALKALSVSKRDAVIRDLFKPGTGCNFNLCRLPIGANDYSLDWYSLNETAGDFAMKKFSIERDRQNLIPFIKSAMAYQPQMGLFASPWSPPTWMKRPAVFNFGRFVMEKKYLDAYALYFARFVESYAKEGIRIDQIHVQNEPVSSQKFPSCVWTGEQMLVFIRDHLGPLFERRKLDTEIWLGTLNGPEPDNRFLWSGYNNYAGLVLEDSKARRYVKGIGYQWAGKNAVQRTRQAWPQFPLMQTENECGDGQNTWEYAMYVFDLFYHYITNGVCGYTYWNMILPPGGDSTWGWKQNAMITVDPESGKVTKNPEYFVMKHFSRYIKPGSRRVILDGSWSGNAVAFRDRKSTVVVARNPFNVAKEINVGAVSGSFKWSLPPSSMATLVLSNRPERLDELPF